MQKLVATLPSTSTSTASTPSLASLTALAAPTALARDRTTGAIEVKTKGPVKVYDYLYLGSRMDARNVGKLKALGITAIVDCAVEYKTIESKGRPLEVKTLHLDLHDDERVITEFRNAAERAIDFIQTQKEKKQKVLVSCHLGTSRAAGIVLAYMMRVEDLDYSQALGKLRNLCAGTDQVILPNKWIESLLAMWE